MVHLDQLLECVEKSPAALDCFQCVLMKQGELLWVPHGTVALPCTDDAKGAAIAVWPWFAVKQMTFLEADDHDLMRQLCPSYVRKNSDKEPFQAMHNPLKTAFAQSGDAQQADGS